MLFWRSQSHKLCRYAAELHILSVTYPYCGLAPTNTTDNPSGMCPVKLSDFCLFFATLILLNLTRATYSSDGFHKLSRPGLKPATLRWESQHSNHAATPTCLYLGGRFCVLVNYGINIDSLNYQQSSLHAGCCVFSIHFSNFT